MRNHVFILCIVLGTMLFPLSASGQVGNCPRSMGEAYLDAGNVRARIVNTGGLFYRGEPHVYEVPKGSGSNALFAANIWISGRIDGEIRAAGTQYGEWEMWAGPLDDNGNPPIDCSQYDRIWEIRSEDIEQYEDTGNISQNLQEWPWYLGAPVNDGDGVPDNYDLQNGDRPQLLGDQRLWWIMNDRGNVHQYTDSDPIGLEIHASAHAFNRTGFAGNTTFYRYCIVNKNTLPFTDAYFTIWTDVDLGDFSDDYVGSDSLLHLGYAYNADNEDGSSLASGEGYGKAPPAIGFTFLESAIADTDGRDNDRDGIIDNPGEMIGANSFLYYTGGGGVYSEPFLAEHFHNYAQAKWKDGSRVVMGGRGVAAQLPDGFPRVPTNFFYSGNPVTGEFWTEINPLMNGVSRAPSDRRMMTSSGPFMIQPGDTLDMGFAIVWSRGKDHLDSVTELKKDVASIRAFADFFLNTANLDLQPKPAEENPQFALGFKQNYPNPFSSKTTLNYSLPKPMRIRLAIYDVLGREVETLVDAGQSEGTYAVDFDGSQLPAGIYYARIEMDYLRFTKRIVKL